MRAYINEKARLVLSMNPETYRENDALGQPDYEFSDEEIELLKMGCMQIREGKGQTADNPFTDIGIHGFYLLMALFHFKLKRQSIVKSSENGIIDMMECEHLIVGEGLVLYNFVKS